MIVLPPVIGHRGAAGLAPENTLASFRRAAALGAAMVEFDVRLSADDVPVVFHDDTLDRTTDGFGPVAAMSLNGLKRLDAGIWFAPGYACEPIPTLEEALALCLDLGLMANLEIKPGLHRQDRVAALTLDTALAVWPAGRTPPLLSSFAAPCLAVARAKAPDWPRGLLVERLPGDWREQAGSLGCATIHADHRHLDSGSVAEIRAAGLAVLAYTVNDRQEEDRLRRMGVTSVFSDFPHSS
ncbi:glycerophosphodiester phosphodiesterase [Magnetospirillum sp. SS-4]|uniref:glycerophosphodiester phosphodiesterase n=1 Tax=Magnetospirillum sp. SS-4 TaxID=2681465 RepID=UPI00138098F5|nr:glycerophosphodiester phosphodiesterase [Magnetospirillum sp. SS-4]CAA7623572.1 Glycerophosphoryl diester phosphodiesterase [Magnetospirillum sp. SS-4]